MSHATRYAKGMKMRQSVAFIFGFAACCVAGGAAPSTDVLAVRAAYAKIVIAWRLGQIENSVDAFPAALPTQFNIALEDMRNVLSRTFSPYLCGTLSRFRQG